MLPVCFMPCASMESPAAAKTVPPASTRYLRKVKQFSILSTRQSYSARSFAEILSTKYRVLSTSLVRHSHGAGRLASRGFLRVLLHQFIALRAQLEEGPGLFIQALALVPVESGFLQDPEHRLGAEVIFVVEAMHRRENLIGGQAGIL